MTIRVLLADDHLLFRQGLRKLLEADPDISIAGEANNGQEAMEMSEAMRPDVILMDLQMPVLGGTPAIEAILSKQPEVGIIVLTMLDTDDYLQNALIAGARGYLLKTASSREVAQAVRAVYRGGSLLGPQMTAKMLAQFRRLSQQGPREVDHGLSEKELAVLRLLASGQSNKEIARTLKYSESTVKNRLSVIFEKLGVQDRTQAVIHAVQTGLLKLDGEA